MGDTDETQAALARLMLIKSLATSGFPELAFVLVCLGHVAPFIKHADDRPVRARERAVLRVRDRVADCVGSCIPDRAVSQPIAD